MVSTAGTIIIVILVLAVAAAVGWVIYARWRAERLGLPPPSWSSFIPFRKSGETYGVQPAPGGVVGWFNDQIRKFRNRNNRTAAGAYEGAPLGGNARAGRRGFGPLDPDEAWDTRVGTEADAYGPGGYYEEQELGLAPRHGAHASEDTGYPGGSSYPMNLAATPSAPPAGFGGEEEGRGRTLSRSPGPGGKGLNVPGKTGANPFDDDAEPSNMSLRGVSPRPIDTERAASSHGKGPDSGESPTERRSIFRENV